MLNNLYIWKRFAVRVLFEKSLIRIEAIWKLSHAVHSASLFRIDNGCLLHWLQARNAATFLSVNRHLFAFWRWQFKSFLHIYMTYFHVTNSLTGNWTKPVVIRFLKENGLQYRFDLENVFLNKKFSNAAIHFLFFLPTHIFTSKTVKALCGSNHIFYNYTKV